MNGRSEQMSQEVRDHVLNRQLLKKEREKLEKAVKNHENIQNLVRQDMAALFDQRKRAAREVVEVVETYVNGLSNSPKEFDRTVQEYRIETCRFNQIVHEIQVGATQAVKIGTATGTAVAGTGVAVAAFGPTAAMAVATTFGVASTGTAIGSRSRLLTDGFIVPNRWPVARIASTARRGAVPSPSAAISAPCYCCNCLPLS